MEDIDDEMWRMFKKQCSIAPQGTALIYSGASNKQAIPNKYSYERLQKECNRVCDLLSIAGVKQYEIVAISLPRSPLLYASVLACIASKIVFLLLEPSLPHSRIVEMFSQVRPTGLLSETSSQHMTESSFFIDQTYTSDTLALGSFSQVRLSCKNPDILYIIFTSGSTGMPKPIMATHKGTLNRLQWMWKEYPFQSNDCLCFSTSVLFVDCIWELLGGILQGIPTVIVSSKNITELFVQVSQNSVTRLTVVPSYLSVLLKSPNVSKAFASLCILASSGEVLPLSVAHIFLTLFQKCRLLNLYGSSEVSGDAFCYEATLSNLNSLQKLAPLSSVPIGYPIRNIQANIKEETDKESGGELVLDGCGVSYGSLQFNNKLFRSVDHRIFHTGDLVSHLATGEYIYHGRLDDQIKVRGIRIDPLEIVTAILSFKNKGLQRALVVSCSERQQLVAYVENTDYSTKRRYYSDDKLANEIVAHLKTCLPEYYLPSLFIFTSKLPLLSSGKIDRKALPKSNSIILSQKRSLPIKEKITTITSYKAGNIGPVTYQQQGIWLSDNMSSHSNSNSIEFSYFCLKEINTEVLKHSINYVIAKHQSLRTVFLLQDGQLLQKVFDLKSDEFEKLCISSFSVKSSQLELNDSSVVLPLIEYNLTDGSPLFRFTLFQNPQICEANRSVFAIQIHHILTDGWAMMKMLNEIEQLYIQQLQCNNYLQLETDSTQSFPLLEYALYQRSSHSEFETKLNFWKKYLRAIDTSTKLPFDYVPRVPILSAKADNIFAQFNISLKDAARFCQQYEVTEFVLFLATLKVTLFLLGSSHDTCIGVPEANRLNAEFSELLGALVTVLIIQTDVSKASSFLVFVQNVKKSLLEAIDNSLPIEYLEHELGFQYTAYDIMMIFHLEDEQPFAQSQMFKNIPVQANSCETSLEIYMSMSTVETNRLTVEVRYPMEYYNRATINGFVKTWNEVTVTLINEPMAHLPSLLNSNMLSYSPDLAHSNFGCDGCSAFYINGRSCNFTDIVTVASNLNIISNSDDVIGIHVRNSLNIVSVALAALLKGRPFVVIEHDTWDHMIQIITATKLSVLVTDSLSIASSLKGFNNGAIRVVDVASLFKSCSSDMHKNGTSNKHQYVYEIEEDGNLVARWITQADIESTNDITSQYLAGREGNLQVLAPYNSALFPLALMLYISNGSISIYTGIDHIRSATTKSASLLIPSNSLPSILDEVKRVSPQLLWLHGPPPGLAFLLHQFPKEVIIISQSLIPSQYLVTHYFEVSDVKEAIVDQSSYMPLGLVPSAISWKIVGVNGHSFQPNTEGMFVASCEKFDVISEKAVRQLPNKYFVLVAQDMTTLSKNSSIIGTAVDKHPEIIWASVTETAIVYISLSPIDLQEYITTTTPAAQVPPVLKRIDELPLTSSLSLNAKKLESILSKDVAAKLKSSLDAECSITSTATDLLKDILGFESIDYERRFQSLGGHSLQAMQFAVQLNDALNFSVTIQSIFEAHSIGSLIQRLHKQAISEGCEIKCQCLQDEEQSVT